MGCSLAWHLAQLGITNVVLLEREPQLGTGSTGKNAGGFRHQFSNSANIELSIESVADDGSTAWLVVPFRGPAKATRFSHKAISYSCGRETVAPSENWLPDHTTVASGSASSSTAFDGKPAVPQFG